VTTASEIAGLLHDPVSGTSRRVRATCSGSDLHLAGDSATLVVDAGAVSVANGGWDGRALHLTWTRDGHIFALTLEPEAARGLAACAPPALSAELGRILQTSRAHERRGRRTIPLVVGIFVVLPLAVLVALFLMRDQLVDAALRRLPPSVDTEVGKLVHTQVSESGKVVASGPTVDAVRAIGTRLVSAASAHPFTFRFEVMRDKTVNAFAAPGGVVVVHTGLLAAAESPDEVAGVLAHEVTHVLHRHSMRQMIFAVGLSGALQILVGSPEGAAGVLASSAAELTSLGYGRDQERDADMGGLDLLQRARLPAGGLLRFFDTLKEGTAPPAFLSSHPAAGDRAARLTEELRRRGAWDVEPLAIDWAAVRESARGL
jgi:beta-barrel assembly-enhancing protease